MEYARIVGGSVAEIIQGTDVPIAERFHPSIVATLVAVPDGSGVGEGWAYTNGEFAPPEPAASLIPDITARQLRLWLLSQGVSLVDVDNAIAALPADQREAARVEWEYSAVYRRTHPLIESIGDMLQFTDAEIDTGFLAAAVL